jgi:hypothetical protein
MPAAGTVAFMVAKEQQLISTAELPAELSEMQGSEKEPRTNVRDANE